LINVEVYELGGGPCEMASSRSWGETKYLYARTRNWSDRLFEKHVYHQNDL